MLVAHSGQRMLTSRSFPTAATRAPFKVGSIPGEHSRDAATTNSPAPPGTRHARRRPLGRAAVAGCAHVHAAVVRGGVRGGSASALQGRVVLAGLFPRFVAGRAGRQGTTLLYARGARRLYAEGGFAPREG